MVKTVLKYFLETPYPSFKIKNLSQYFTLIYIIKGFLAALLLSSFIYIANFGFQANTLIKLLNTITALASFYLFLNSKREVNFWFGAFVGLFWFYWIALSFRYYEQTLFIPFMWIFLGFGYGIFFWFISLFTPLMRALLFGMFSYFHPMNFNWFIPELSLIDSFFKVDKISFLIILISIALFIELRSKYRYTLLLAPLLTLQLKSPTPLPMPKQSIYLSSLKTPQDLKWEESYKEKSININLKIIKKAIYEGYDIVVLSESAFALFLNMDGSLMQTLKDLSKKITIVTGGLYYDGKDNYNSTYYFIDGKVKIANKVVLVPFGEEIPLPKFISKFINKIFYNGAEDYISAKEPVDIDIKGEIFRNAICYESTTDIIYKNSPKFMIAISNNAWFTPSIEPTLQHLLLRYFSKKYHTTIFHSANMAKTAIIR